MASLTHSEIIIFLLSIGIMLGTSLLLAECAKNFGLPEIIGELTAGIVLGPTIMGRFFPELLNFLFPSTEGATYAFDGLFTLSTVMLLFIAGLEINLPLIFKQGKKAICISFMSLLVPFSMSSIIAWFYPEIFGIDTADPFKWVFAMFLGTALSISALPVIARILMNLDLFNTDIGALIISSAIFNDLVGWLLFSFILGTTSHQAQELGLGYTIVLFSIFGFLMLTVGKILINQALSWSQRKLSLPGGGLSICIGICLVCAAFTEFINVHAFLGAFIAGIVIGDSPKLHEQAREVIHHFASNFFAPLFFVSIGLKVDYIANFDPLLVAIIIFLAFTGKVAGASVGAWIGGVKKNQALAIAFGLNARGAMEIIIGTLALNAGLITTPIFVGLVFMAMVTSLTCGPLMKLCLYR